jgi:Superinfection immunity protein
MAEEAKQMHLFGFFLFPFFGFGFLMYFLPSVVAFARNKRDTTSIVLLNFFLGWSVIGWVIALVWAFKNDVPMAVR